MIVSECCHAEITAYQPVRCYGPEASPDDPVPVCTECGKVNPEEIELEPQPCYHCEGAGWVWSHGKKRVCPVCHGRGTEAEEE